jgi:hypothetical protein
VDGIEYAGGDKTMDKIVNGTMNTIVHAAMDTFGDAAVNALMHAIGDAIAVS